jgi:hypothetical protein
MGGASNSKRRFFALLFIAGDELQVVRVAAARQRAARRFAYNATIWVLRRLRRSSACYPVIAWDEKKCVIATHLNNVIAMPREVLNDV